MTVMVVVVDDEAILPEDSQRRDHKRCVVAWLCFNCRRWIDVLVVLACGSGRVKSGRKSMQLDADVG